MIVPYFFSFHFFFLPFFFFNATCKLQKKPNETSKKYKSLTEAQKKEICLKKTATPIIKQKELAVQYGVSEGMISDILREKERWLVIDSNSLQANLRREKSFISYH